MAASKNSLVDLPPEIIYKTLQELSLQELLGMKGIHPKIDSVIESGVKLSNFTTADLMTTAPEEIEKHFEVGKRAFTLQLPHHDNSSWIDISFDDNGHLKRNIETAVDLTTEKTLILIPESHDFVMKPDCAMNFARNVPGNVVNLVMDRCRFAFWYSILVLLQKCASKNVNPRNVPADKTLILTPESHNFVMKPDLAMNLARNVPNNVTNLVMDRCRFAFWYSILVLLQKSTSENVKLTNLIDDNAADRIPHPISFSAVVHTFKCEHEFTAVLEHKSNGKIAEITVPGYPAGGAVGIIDAFVSRWNTDQWKVVDIERLGRVTSPGLRLVFYVEDDN